MGMISGIAIELLERSQNGVDDFGRPTYEETPVRIENVLIAPVGSQEQLDTLNLTGRRAEYTLGIPKEDVHEWENKKVRFFGEEWRVIGIPTEGISDLIPLAWNKKVTVERFE